MRSYIGTTPLLTILDNNVRHFCCVNVDMQLVRILYMYVRPPVELDEKRRGSIGVTVPPVAQSTTSTKNTTKQGQRR